MKVIGLIGGLTWQATVDYYKIINEQINAKLGGHHSGKIIIASVDFDEIFALANANKWNEMAGILSAEAVRLEKAGANLIIICANTAHKIYNEIKSSIKIPVLDIIDLTAIKIQEKKFKKVGLLGTRFTMQDGFYHEGMKRFGIEILTPSLEERDEVHRIIFDELVFNNIKEASRKKYIGVINNLIESGAQGIVLGCTEIPLLIKQEHVSIPIFDTTVIHALAAVDEALK
jgi:aspartate racemase